MVDFAVSWSDAAILATAAIWLCVLALTAALVASCLRMRRCALPAMRPFAMTNANVGDAPRGHRTRVSLVAVAFGGARGALLEIWTGSPWNHVGLAWKRDDGRDMIAELAATRSTDAPRVLDFAAWSRSWRGSLACSAPLRASSALRAARLTDAAVEAALAAESDRRICCSPLHICPTVVSGRARHAGSTRGTLCTEYVTRVLRRLGALADLDGLADGPPSPTPSEVMLGRMPWVDGFALGAPADVAAPPPRRA